MTIYTSINYKTIKIHSLYYLLTVNNDHKCGLELFLVRKLFILGNFKFCFNKWVLGAIY